MAYIPETLNLLGQNISGVSVERLILFFILILSTFIIRYIFLYIIDRKIAQIKIMRSDAINNIINAIKGPIGYLILTQGFYIAIIYLQLPEKVGPFEIASIVSTIYVLIISFIILFFAFKIVDIVALFIDERAKKTDSILDEQLVPLIIKSLRILVITIGLLSILQNFGYNITTLVAGLGLGGLAFALAAQTTISNIFGSVTIFSDKHFRIGDWIQVGDVNGIVEELGFRTTRIRRFDQALVTVPNSMFVNKEIINYSSMQKRKIEFYLGITYETTIDKIKLVVNGIKSIIENDEKFERSTYVVRFTDFGESSLNIYIYCFTTVTEFIKFQGVKEELNLKIIELLNNLDVELAFSSRTIYVHNQKRDET